MKKIYTLLSLLMAFTVGSLESHAGQVTFRIDHPEAVKISVQNYDNYQTVYPELKEGDNVIEYTDGISYYISIESTNGWGLESIKAEGDYSDLPVNYNSSYIYISEYSQPVDGNIYTINVYDKEASRTASFEVTVTDEDFDPNLLRVYRGNEYILIDENPKTVSFNPASETEVQFGRTDYGDICSVKLNGVSLTSPGSSFRVADGDKVTVTVSYPDVDLPVSFTLPEGCEDVLTKVQVNYNDVDNWADPDFAVRAGSSLQFQVNDNKYVIDHVYVNDVEQSSYSNYYSIRLGQDALDIVIEAHPYNTFSVTVNADEPSRLKVTDYFGELLPLTGATTVLEISEKQPMITIKALPDYLIDSMTDAEGNPIELNSYNSIDVTDGMVINVATSEKVYDSRFALYVDTTEGLYSSYWMSEDDRTTYNEIHEGYNIIRFASAASTQYMLACSGDRAWVAFLNGEPVTNQYQSGYYSWTGNPENGMLVKLYYNGEPQSHNVAVNVSDELADKVTVLHDKIISWTDLSAPKALLAGSHIDMLLADDADATVRVDGEPVTPGEDGFHNIVVSGDHEITVTANNALLLPGDADEAEAKADVFNMQGIRVLSGAKAADLRALPAGIYIHNGRKVVVK